MAVPRFTVDHSLTAVVTRAPSWASMTLEQHRALDAAGRLRRPITDTPIGETTAGRRAVDANSSAAIPTTPSTGGPR